MSLIKFQFKLIINKASIILLIVSIFFLSFIYVSVMLSLDKSDPDSYNRYLYFNSSSLYFRLILNLISIYIFSYCFSKKQEEATYLLIMLKYSRLSIVLSRIIICITILFLISCFSFVSFSSIGIFSDGFYLDFEFLNGYISILICAIVFGFIASIIIVIINNMFTVILSIILSIFVGELDGSSWINKILFFIFPSINEFGISYYGYLHYLFLVFLYFFILVILYYNKDIM